MKVVIDTNVLLSAVIRDRLPEKVLRWCLANDDVRWLVSPAILAEYLEVIQRPRFALPPEVIDWWASLLTADTVMTPMRPAPDFPRDRKDAPFLACAGGHSADYLITGDGDFSEARHLIPQVKIVSVREFALAVGLDST
ncbi:MAG: putative toxin-antitoxin system toxin component, PIN family [Candidatus Accumulibacter adjunctus]|uniref:Toxin-antitoxin system toxin component, PIN family n=1 Tax=Candidatus Accumulibacter adjunctus TaxID=1454001 RepID=A0A011PFV9_9PROT|nr:MAG: putative toxin-antitoxin system toxin component, PIN family [Candidatus Accumulibacter adjunctus]